MIKKVDAREDEMLEGGETMSIANGGATLEPDHPATELPNAAAFEQIMEVGKAALKANDFVKAEQSFREAADLDRGQLEPQLWLCRVAYRQYAWMELYSRTVAYLARRPDDREAMLLHGRACNGLADWPSAAKTWAQVAEDRPDWAEPLYQRAKAEIRQGDRDTASKLADQLLSMRDETYEASAFAARILVELDELGRAGEAFEALTRNSPDLCAREVGLLERQNDQRGLAVALAARKKLAGPVRGDDERALNVSESLFRDAISHERAGGLLDAFLDYEALIALSPEDGLAKRSRDRIIRELRSRADDQLTRQNFQEAATAFERSIRTAPADVALKRNYGRVLMRLREWSKAAPVWEALSALAPQDTEAALQLARALDRSGRFSEAVVAWRKVVQLTPDSNEAKESLSTIVRRMTFAGRAAITEARFLDAYDLFKAVLREEPQDEEGRQRLEQVGRNLLKSMRAAYKVGDLRAVIKYAAAASDLLPDDPEVRLLVGRSASSMRRYEVALAAWARLAELDPSKRTLALLQIARCYLHLGASKQGQEVLRKVLTTDPDNVDARALMERFRSNS